MSKLEWDKTGERLYETGVEKGVLFPFNVAQNKYDTGVAWNGLTAVNENPSGAEATALWADDIKYLELRSAEEFGATIECYTYPPEFEPCNGVAALAPGISIGQQVRQKFGFSYVTKIGNDTEYEDHGYKIHVIYGASVSPSDKAYQTINDSPEAITFSYEMTTTPVKVTGFKPTAHLEIDSTKVDAAALTAIENKLYGTDDGEPTLLLPDEIVKLINGTGATGATGATGSGTSNP